MVKKVFDWLSIGFVIVGAVTCAYYIIESLVLNSGVRTLVLIVFCTTLGVYLFFNGIEQLIRLSNKKG